MLRNVKHYKILDDFLESKSTIKCQDDLRRKYKSDTGFGFNLDDDYDVDDVENILYG